MARRSPRLFAAKSLLLRRRFLVFSGECFAPWRLGRQTAFSNRRYRIDATPSTLLHRRYSIEATRSTLLLFVPFPAYGCQLACQHATPSLRAAGKEAGLKTLIILAVSACFIVLAVVAIVGFLIAALAGQMFLAYFCFLGALFALFFSAYNVVCSVRTPPDDKDWDACEVDEAPVTGAADARTGEGNRRSPYAAPTR